MDKNKKPKTKILKRIFFTIIIIILSLLVLLFIYVFLNLFVFYGEWPISEGCGKEFENKFQQALQTEDINFCFQNHSAYIKYNEVSHISHYFYCKTEDGVRFEKKRFEYFCVPYFAKKFNNSNYCNQTTNNGAKEKCFKEIAFMNNNVSLCADYNCFSIFASKLKDPTICDNIKNDESGQEYCFRTLSKELKNISICNMINDIEEINLCKKSYIRNIENN